jgi:hypothetical protein
LTALCTQARAGRSNEVKPFNSAEWQTSYANAFNKKSASLVKKHLSRIYNVTGENRDDVVKRLGKAFKAFDKVALEYDVLEVKQPAPGHAVLKITSVLKGVRSDTKETVTLSEKQGFDSLVYEAGNWRMFDSVTTVAKINQKLEPGMELFAACPNAEAAGTPQAGANGGRQLIRVGNFAQSTTFVPSAWEARVNRAWSSKDVGLVGSLYSDLYSHAGYGKNDVLTQTAVFFNQFGNITCSYQVLNYSYVGSGLVSVQATIQLHAEPSGGGTPTLVFQTFGYGSLKDENGVWRLYATQPR